jgi:hypothetical protein
MNLVEAALRRHLLLFAFVAQPFLAVLFPLLL